VVSESGIRLKPTKFAVLDTAVYIENFRTGRFAFRILRSPLIIRCSSVVLHELLRGAKTRVEHRFVTDLARRCRTLTPTESHWMQAAEVLGVLKKREHYDTAKIRELAFDVLIALSARSIGATLITCNEADFQIIRRHLSYSLVCWK
jgi:predicted nucleic acid-binding protein